MNYDREVVFAFLEEDNTQRVYFRLKPLLCASGDMREEALKLWPDEGGLRIVPDKNEQCYFKDRMRELGSYCLMDLTPFPGVRAEIRAISRKYPNEVIIGLNKRDPEYHDLYRLNIETGNMTLILENREFSGFEIDDDFNVRLASNMTADGGSETVIEHDGPRGWTGEPGMLSARRDVAMTLLCQPVSPAAVERGASR